MKFKSLSKLGLLFASVAFVACTGGHEVVKNPEAQPVAPSGKNGVPANPIFADVQKALSAEGRSCVQCHSENSKRPLVRYDQVKVYVVAGSPTASKLYTELRNAGGEMPPEGKGDPLTSDEAETIRLWIEQGAWETKNTETPTTTTSLPPPEVIPPPETTTTTSTSLPSLPPALNYQTVMKAFLETKCGDCHNDTKTKADVNIYKYEDMIMGLSANGSLVVVPGKPLESALYTEIEKASMPPKKAIDAGKAFPVTKEELDLLKQWIVEGAIK